MTSAPLEQPRARYWFDERGGFVWIWHSTDPGLRGVSYTDRERLHIRDPGQKAKTAFLEKGPRRYCIQAISQSCIDEMDYVTRVVGPPEADFRVV